MYRRASYRSVRRRERTLARRKKTAALKVASWKIHLLVFEAWKDLYQDKKRKRAARAREKAAAARMKGQRQHALDWAKSQVARVA